MNLQAFLQTRRGRITAAVVLVLIFLVLPVVLYLLTSHNGSVLPTKSYYSKALPMSPPVGAYAEGDTLYIANGRSIVSYKNGQSQAITGDYILPSMDQLYLNSDHTRAIFRSTDYTPGDVTQQIRDDNNLTTDQPYWWSMDLKTGTVRLMGNIQLTLTDVKYDQASDTLTGLSAPFEGGKQDQSLYSLNSKGDVLSIIHMPQGYTLQSFVRTGNTIYGVTTDNVLQKLTISGNQASMSSTLQTDCVMGVFADDARWVYIQKQGDGVSLTGFVYDLATNKQVMNIGDVDEGGATWTTSGDQLLVNQPVQGASQSLNMIMVDPSARSQQALVTHGSVDNSQINQILTASPSIIVGKNVGNGVSLVTEQNNSLPTSYKDFTANNQNGVTVAYQSSTGYALATQESFKLTPEQVRANAMDILKKNGFDPNLTQIEFSYAQQLNPTVDQSQ